MNFGGVLIRFRAGILIIPMTWATSRTSTVVQELAAEAAAAEARRRRVAQAREERDLATAVHKAQLLWLLARGLLFDAAADDELLQVALACTRTGLANRKTHLGQKV